LQEVSKSRRRIEFVESGGEGRIQVSVGKAEV
jgi:hypothetical protein